jgi:hypothetical protein
MTKTLLSTALLLGLTACITNNAAPSRIDASLLRGLSAEQKEPIDALVESSRVARKSYSTARKQTKIAEDAVVLARKELSVVTSRVRAERVTLAAVTRGSDDARIPSVEAEYVGLLRIGRVARYGLALSRREHELAALQERLCLEELRLADARVEVARAMALERMNVRAKDAVPLEDIEENASFHGREVAVADRRLADARSRMTQARAEFEGAIAEMQRAEQAAR